MFEVIEKILADTKKKRANHDYFGIVLNAEAILEYLPAIINYEVEQEQQYRQFEAKLALERDESGKLRTGSYCETQAKATPFYPEYRKAQLFRELMYEVINISKKLAGSIGKEFNAQ